MDCSRVDRLRLKFRRLLLKIHQHVTGEGITEVLLPTVGEGTGVVGAGFFLDFPPAGGGCGRKQKSFEGNLPEQLSSWGAFPCQPDLKNYLVRAEKDLHWVQCLRLD
jgi:hypothetical protein